MDSQATVIVEQPKQDREQLVQERKRERKDLDGSGLTMFHLNRYVSNIQRHTSANLALSCRKAISLRTFRALFMSFGFKCLTCGNLERISYTYPILSNQFHFLIIITYNYDFVCFPFNQSNSINISKFEIYINLYNVGYRLVWGGPPKQLLDTEQCRKKQGTGYAIR